MTTGTIEPVLILGPDPDPTEWQEARRRGIGSSDASTVLGLNKYQAPFTLYLDKVGEIPPLDENEPMRWGRKLEPFVADEFAERSGIDILPTPGTWAHPDRSWQLFNPDRLTADGGILECKTTTAWLAHEWDNDEVPVHALVQAMHGLAVSGRTHAYIAGLIGGQKFHWVRVERDDDLIATITEHEQDFWRCVQERTPPAATHRDLAALAKVHQVEPDAVHVCTPAEAARIRELAQLHREATVLAKEAEQVKKDCTAELAQILGAAELAAYDDDLIATYKQHQRKGYEVKPTTYRTAKFLGEK